ncbi:MAG TPA: hypothetical protein VMV69_01585 [Pirellulales bacterium]|nr:hypothetical protein [Pirellulales bacterium]
MRRAPVASEAGKALTAAPSPVCPSVCTSEGQNANADHLDGDAGDPLDPIVNAIRKLPEAQQAELVRWLGEPRPDAQLAAVLKGWPKLSASVKAGVAAVIDGFAKSDEGDLGPTAAVEAKPKARSKAKGKGGR